MTAASAVIAIYDGVAFLAASVQSIVRRTHPDIEFVIVDDGSAAR